MSDENFWLLLFIITANSVFIQFSLNDIKADMQSIKCETRAAYTNSECPAGEVTK